DGKSVSFICENLCQSVAANNGLEKSYESASRQDRQRHCGETSLKASVLSRLDARGIEQGGADRLREAVLSPRRRVPDLSIGRARKVRRSTDPETNSFQLNRRRGRVAESS